MDASELQAAYDDAMKRIRGSICTQWADPIEAYVQGLRDTLQRIGTHLVETDQALIETLTKLESSNDK